ncbi:alpha/beta hydrolase [Idiomarina tyrosinivorans]|uniref:Alpha/beta hydrolase n=1 Tax=Idiomarina tyrosinivorans TaxID=1445662 RepID=A0A432ZLG7_9GAMM|nr:alpha/beta hydrolase [Idiomarina tyrosinivorans]RUO78744.1 alpha/beta hydrolase [Idiomarina tyrosinivorans]
MDAKYESALAHATALEWQLPWGKLRGLSWGKPSDTPIVALHGWLDNANSFLPLASEWQADEQQLIAIDWPGHGHSDHRPAGAHYHFVDYVYDLWWLIKQQGWQPYLLGHSMGGFIAQVTTALLPKAVQRLWTVEAFGLLIAEERDALKQLSNSFRHRQQFEGASARQPASYAQAVAARAKKADFAESLVELLVQRGLQQQGDKIRWRADPRVRVHSPYRMKAEDVETILPGIQCPMTVILGDSGFTELQQALSRWRGLVPQLQQLSWGGGHHVHMQQPQKLAAQLLADINADD